jgi:hypothetical protein
MGLFDWMKEKAAEAIEEREWTLWLDSNKGLTMGFGLVVMQARSIHGVLTFACVEGRGDLIAKYENSVPEEKWQGVALLEGREGWTELHNFYIETRRQVGGLKAPFWGDVGPYTMETWHQKVVSAFPTEQARAYQIFRKADPMGADCLHGKVKESGRL